MTEKRYIINNNGDIENTSNHMTWDSFTEVLTILNGQSRHLEELGEENEQLKEKLNEIKKGLISDLEKGIGEQPFVISIYLQSIIDLIGDVE